MSKSISPSTRRDETIASPCSDVRQNVTPLTIDDELPNSAAITLSGKQEPVDKTPLTEPERLCLRDLERTIEGGLNTFYRVGEALIYIKSKRLYRQDHPTFEAYCASRWYMSRAYAYRLIDASTTQTQLRLSPIGDIPLPQNEAQSRKLSGLNADQKVKAMVLAKEKAGAEPITSTIIEEAADEVVKRVRTAKPKSSKRPTVNNDFTPTTGLEAIQRSVEMLEEVRQWIFDQYKDWEMVKRLDQVAMALGGFARSIAHEVAQLKTCVDEVKNHLDPDTTVPVVKENLEKMEQLELMMTRHWATKGLPSAMNTSVSKN